ncbi:MAG: molybdate ABC transporter substrate-binding protein [Spirochaetia bacterium]|nr:molybdate ABC transporter substrate-binding protein [Spirochaetia bacterium]
MRYIKIKLIHTLLILVLLFNVRPAQADEVKAAVAANFSAPMKQIIDVFEKETGNTVKVSFGSSGKLYSQIQEGASFDIFLSADESVPIKLVKENLAEVHSIFIYALGKLVLWSPKQNYAGPHESVVSKLENGQFKKLAIANPKLAPYGMAAYEVLENMSLLNTLQNKIVMGESITQTYQFAATENVDFAFIALSQITKNGHISGGSFWLVPANLYKPIKQSAVLLSCAQNNNAAKAFLIFLKSQKSKDIIQSFGYEAP